MAIEVVTKEDLQEFRIKLLEDIRKLISPPAGNVEKPWLKNSEVRKLLSVSSNTIQRLRIAGKLRSTKIGGVHYYRYEDIEKLMNHGDA
jgi:hypothetical protein